MNNLKEIIHNNGKAIKDYEMQKETVYVKLERDVEIQTDDVYLKDLGKIYCKNDNIVNRCKTIKITKISQKK